MNPIDLFSKLCYPAQFFIVFFVIDLTYILFIGMRIQEKFNFKLISLTLLILSLLSIGWTYIINFMCDTKNNYISWGLASIPLMLISLKFYI